MSEATRNGWQCRPWTRTLSALALMSALGLGGGPRALAQPEVGEKLSEGNRGESGQDSTHLFECRGAFCAWEVSTHLGPCSGSRCYNDTLYVTDSKGRILSVVRDDKGSPAIGMGREGVHFTEPRQLEILNHTYPYVDPKQKD